MTRLFSGIQISFQLFAFANIHFRLSEGILHLQNGWYYSKIREVGEYQICASFLIKQEYAYSNDELINDFSSRLNLPFTASISLEQDAGYPVFSEDGWFVFSILPNDYQSADRMESIALMLLLIITIVLWLYWLSILSKKVDKKMELGIARWFGYSENSLIEIKLVWIYAWNDCI